MLKKEKREKIKKNLKKAPFLFKSMRLCYIFTSSIIREIKTFIRYFPRFIAKKFGFVKQERWQTVLPIQKVRRVNLDIESFSIEFLKKEMKKNSLEIHEGGDSIYVPPKAWKESSLNTIQDDYPRCCGIKISKRKGDSNNYYMEDRVGRQFAQKLSFPHEKQILIYNYLNDQGVSPKLYDLVELEDKNNDLWTAYIVEHIPSSPLKPGDLEEMIERLKALCLRGNLELIGSSGWNGIDFEPPNCNSNLIRSEKKDRTYYVDIHNFILKDYDQLLNALALKTASTSHFGGKSIFLGGEFLYQEIPGVNLPSKRSPNKRMVLIDELLKRSGLDLKEKVILDIGCNLGLMGAQYLKRGARWLHGWDMENVVPATERILNAIGCTRFSLTGGMLGSDVSLSKQLPPHLNYLSNEETVINYLAIRGHIGWLKALQDLPWSYMLYESHQEDGPLEGYIQELNKMVPVEIAAKGTIADGTSQKRDVAIIKRIL